MLNRFRSLTPATLLLLAACGGSSGTDLTSAVTDAIPEVPVAVGAPAPTPPTVVETPPAVVTPATPAPVPAPAVTNVQGGGSAALQAARSWLTFNAAQNNALMPGGSTYATDVNTVVRAEVSQGIVTNAEGSTFTMDSRFNAGSAYKGSVAPRVQFAVPVTNKDSLVFGDTIKVTVTEAGKAPVVVSLKADHSFTLSNTTKVPLDQALLQWRLPNQPERWVELVAKSNPDHPNLFRLCLYAHLPQAERLVCGLYEHANGARKGVEVVDDTFGTGRQYWINLY